ncbi:formylglycine-generating enzyme family protein [Christiangramia fulva]|uniref:Formylglycine-generating enzyme family protein n=1 Tax=Christiangramia fulva TaxID=2126553 RepID=A0A2R3Z9U6_9FLAO|nr:formylglycine-generating enzyme family protein [Christiangramia fulva]AVR46952.1 formylglycine-generating enzyme family protein [Christiangramia fulva]
MSFSFRFFIITVLAGLLFTGCQENKKNTPINVVESKPVIPHNDYYKKYMREISFIKTRADSASTKGMLKIKGGDYMMGSSDSLGKRDEYPRHQETVKDLWVDKTEVTNAQFREFVEATGYVTTAERSFEINGKKYEPGSLVFDPTNPRYWWKFTKGANWKHPEGPDTNIKGKDDYPVVQVSWYDAMAYAKWAGKRLPTEAEFEYLNRAGNDTIIYNWGNDFSVATEKANFFQGDFPFQNFVEDHYEKAAPVKSFPANNFGLYDTTGNVWEWCLDTYYPDAYLMLRVRENGYFKDYENRNQEKVIRGGSFLCSESYCKGYRTSTRMSSAPDSGLEHTGFRCVRDVKKS